MLIKYIVAYTLLFFGYTTYAQYQVEHFTTDNGMPSNGIKGMQWDERTGFLWIATEAGMLRYDGMSFKTFDVSTNAEFGSNRIVMIVKNAAGNILVGSEDANLSVIKNNAPVLFFKGTEEAKKVYGHFGAVTASDTLFKKCFNDPWDERYNFYNSTVLPLNDTACEILTNGKLYYYSISTNQPRQVKEVPDNVKKIFSIEGQVYLVDADNHLLLFDIYEKTLQRVILINGDGSYFNLGKEGTAFFWETGMPQPILIQGGEAWIIEKKHPTVLVTTLIGENIPENVFIKFVQYEKNSRNLFLGSASKGIYIVHENQLTNRHPLKSSNSKINAFYSQVALPDGNVMLHDGSIAGDHEPADNYNILSPFINNVFALTDSTLILVKRDSIFNYNWRTRQNKLLAQTLTRENFCFAFSGNKLYYFGRIGIGIIDESGNIDYLQYFKNDGKSGFLPYAMLEVTPGKLLIATCGGLLGFDTKTNRLDTLSGPSCFRTLFKEGNYIFMGTYGNGFYVMKDGKIKAMPLDVNQYLKYTHCFLKDNQGFCWISTNNGLFKVKVSDIIDVYEKDLPQLYYRYMGKAEGMETTEMNGGCNPCGLKLKDGTFSFPTMDGLIWFKPEKVNVSLPSKDIYIDKIVVDNKVANADGSGIVQLPSAFTKLDIWFVTDAWCGKENLYVDYRVDDAQWVRIDILAGELRINPGNVAYGNHTLQIRKLNGFGTNNYSVTTVAFTIATPYYHQWWFRILVLLFLFSIGFVYIKLRLRQYKRRAKKLSAMVEEKTHDLNIKNIQLEKNDQIKTRLISVINHDIITPLKFMHYAGKALVQNKGLIGEEEQAQTIAEITQAARDMEMLSSQILNWIIYQNPHERMQKEEFDLIRLKNIKPKGLPDFIGVNSENGAHRIAVEWDENGVIKSGVYIPRRDTSLKLNALVGGRIFPGRHYYAKFNIEENNGNYHIDFKSADNTEILIDATETRSFSDQSIFETLDNASDFFKNGDLGYSPNKHKFDGLRLKAYNWKVRPLEVQNVKSSFFENEEIFPKGSVTFDNALLMTDIEHEWKSETDK